jgi:hypothetical protein
VFLPLVLMSGLIGRISGSSRSRHHFDPGQRHRVVDPDAPDVRPDMLGERGHGTKTDMAGAESSVATSTACSDA